MEETSYALIDTGKDASDALTTTKASFFGISISAVGLLDTAAKVLAVSLAEARHNATKRPSNCKTIRAEASGQEVATKWNHTRASTSETTALKHYLTTNF